MSSSKENTRRLGLPSMQCLRNRAARSLDLKSAHDDKSKANEKTPTTKHKIVAKMVENAKAASAHAPPAKCQYAFV